MSVSSTQFTRFLLIPAIQRIMRATPGSETVGEAPEARDGWAGAQRGPVG